LCNFMSPDSKMEDRTRYRLHPDVVWILRPDGSSCLMHMSANVCAIDAVSTNLLKSLIEVGPERSAAEQVARHSVDEPRVREDIRVFITDLRKQKVIYPLLYRDPPLEKARTVAARIFVSGVLCLVHLLARNLRLRVWGLLWAAKWAVAQFGWARAVREWERVYPQPAAETLANTEKLEAIDLTVRKIAARSLLSVECKERALACLALARKNGIPAQLIVGVTHYPLQGHVWVESANRIISDNPEHCRLFEPVARYG
jgi:hypothetical protein